MLGDPAAAVRAAAAVREVQAKLGDAFPVRMEYDNGLEAQKGNLCADTEYPRLFQVWSAIGAFAASWQATFGPPSWWSARSPCANWPVAEDRYIGPWATRTAAPVLVVGNYFDGITGYDGAVAASQLLVNSRLLSYAGWGHTAFDKSDCAREHTVRYLLDGTLPPEGTVCPANPNPFLPAPMLRATAAAPKIVRPPPWLRTR